MNLEDVLAAVASLDDDRLKRAFREAADTPGTENALLHHVAASEMTKRGLGLGVRTPFHRGPLEVGRRTVANSALDLPLAVRKEMPDVIELVTVLDYDGFSTIIVPPDEDLWDIERIHENEGWEDAVAKAGTHWMPGDLVSWDTDGGTGHGMVVRVDRSHAIDIPGSSFSINPLPNDPALLIDMWSDSGMGWKPSGVHVGIRSSEARHCALIESEFDSSEPRVAKTIRRKGDEYCVYSEDGTRRFGCYPTRSQAMRRLGQIESFSKVRPENPWKRGYDTEYFENRDSILSKSPKCAVCRKAKAQEVDHITPIVSGGTNKRSNLRPVCRSCNRKEGGAVRRAAKADSFSPPDGVQRAAQRALDWIGEGHAGSGFTDTGRRRASQLAAGESVSAETLGRMRSFFARHSVNRGKTGWNEGEEGYPIPARVAWDAWGGDAGRSWAESTAVGKSSLVSKSVDEKRYTMGPMYIPNAIDAQGEWTDEDELQQAVWKYVRSGDRRIRLQHNKDIVAGEWVECMAWPYEVTVPMIQPESDGRSVDTMTFPSNTVFLGVVWEPWSWELVKSGSLRGFSIGGSAARVLVDIDGS